MDKESFKRDVHLLDAAAEMDDEEDAAGMLLEAAAVPVKG